jgi:DNA-binding response OmpR family regulator
MTKRADPKKVILAVDDDPETRSLLRMVLEQEGYSVGEAASGEEGLKTARRIMPDAIIVDLMMEEVDSGVQLARKLKEDGFTCPIFLLSSAGDTVQYNLDADEIGLAGIFQKPINAKTVLSVIRAKVETC